MTRYVLLAPYSTKPKAMYKTAAQFARLNGKIPRTVQISIKKKGYYHSSAGTLWPVEIVEE